MTRVAAPSLAKDGLTYKPNLTLRGPDRLTVLFDDIQGPF